MPDRIGSTEIPMCLGPIDPCVGWEKLQAVVNHV